MLINVGNGEEQTWCNVQRYACPFMHPPLIQTQQPRVLDWYSNRLSITQVNGRKHIPQDKASSI